ncbi:hypothetical protein ACP6EK_07680 [Candidatus Caldatribacterium sp. SIUC1]|uniref:hypothetical protein n=1 Tax=Candidatus Caldatribacterium sp. SIUC1 TaxID=3418365 RepID=UPI003F690EF5
MHLERAFLVEIPHPLNSEEKIVVGLKSSLKKHYQRLWAFWRSPAKPFLLYCVDSASPDASTRKRVLEYERRLFTQWRREYESALGRDLLTLVLCILLSYAIWNIGFIFQAVDALFMLAGDYLNPYARVVLIIAPLLYGVYHKLLVGDTIFAKRKAFAFLELPLHLGAPQKAEFEKDLKKFIARAQGPQKEALLALLRALENNDEETAKSILSALSTYPLPFKETQQITSLCRELEFLLEGQFSHRICRIRRNEALEEFFSSPLYQSFASQLQRLVQELPSSSVALFETLQALEQTLCSRMRGKVEEEVLEALLEYYRETRHALISRARRTLKLFESPREFHLFPTPVQTVLVSFLLVGVSFLLFSVHLVDREDFLIVRSLKIGWQGFLGERLDIVERGVSLGSKKLLLTTPRPFAFAHRGTRRPQSVDALLLLREVEPAPQGGMLGTLRYLWEKSMAFFKEGYGNDFVVLHFSFKFQIADPERWKQYDFDGRGKERLSRDLESFLLAYADRVREKYRQAFFEEEYETARAKLVEISQSQTFREWIRRFLYPSPLDTYRVGSVYDMYLLGLEWLRRHPHMENNPEWQAFVEHEMALIREKMQSEHDDLIANPLRVRDFVRNPNVLELADYPGLYQTLLVMAINEIAMGKLLEDLKDEAYRRGFEGEALQYLKSESRLFQSIGVDLLEVRTSLERVSYLYYLRYLQKRQNLL